MKHEDWAIVLFVLIVYGLVTLFCLIATGVL